MSLISSKLSAGDSTVVLTWASLLCLLLGGAICFLSEEGGRAVWITGILCSIFALLLNLFTKRKGSKSIVSVDLFFINIVFVAVNLSVAGVVSVHY